MSEKPDSGSGLVLGYKFDLGPACVLPFFFPFNYSSHPCFLVCHVDIVLLSLPFLLVSWKDHNESVVLSSTFV